MDVPVNYLAILFAAVASMVAGFLWYGPLILGKPWMRLKGYTEESLKEAQATMGPLYGISFILALLQAFILSHMSQFSESYFGYGLFSTALTTAFYLWLGFIMPTQATMQIFGHKNWKLFGIDTGYQLVSVMIMGLVIGLMGV